MASSETMRRPGGSRSMAPVTFALWALWAIALSSFHLKAWFESRNAIVCADQRALFYPDHVSDPLAYQSFDDGRLVVIERSGRFPFSLRSALGGIQKPNTLRFVDRSSGQTLSTLTATVDERWSTLGRIFAWSGELLVWTYIERRDPATGNPVRSYRRFLTNGKTETPIAGSAAFEPRAVDAHRQRVASLEERQRVMGGQPKEHELPPQTVRIESFAGSEPSIVATFPVRRALRFFFRDDALMVLRWEGDTVPPYWSYRFRIFLDRHDPPDYATTWSVELTPQPTEQGRGPNGPEVVVTPGQLTGTSTFRYLDNAPGPVVRDVRVDTTNGELIESSVEPYTSRWNARSPGRGAELDWRKHGTLACLYEAPVKRWKEIEPVRSRE